VRARARGLVPALIARLSAPPACAAAGAAQAALLAAALRDADAALEFAARGGHAPLAAALARAAARGDEAALEPLAAAAALSLRALPRSAAGFRAPARADAVDAAAAPPLEFDFSSFLCAPAVDADALGGGARAPAPARAALPRVLVRLVSPLRARQASQADVGFALWPAALPLSRWVVAHRAPLLSGGARVLEVGAGVGLCGVVAALAAPRGAPPVWLSDFNATVLDNLARNAALNEPRAHARDADERALAELAEGGADAPPRMRVAFADWSCDAAGGEARADGGGEARADGADEARADGAEGDGEARADGADEARADGAEGDGAPARSWEPALPAGALFDVILGSDMICSAADARGVAAAVRARLAPRGVAVLLLPPPDVRWGVDALPAAAAAAGLALASRALAPDFLRATWVPGGGGCGDGGAAAAAAAAGAREADAATTASGYEPRARLYFLRHA